jgi:hypothetical protein
MWRRNKMGILTRVHNDKWIIEIREKWYCEKESQAKEVQDYLLKIRTAFEMQVEEIEDKPYYTFDMKNKKVEPATFKDCIIIHNEILEFKRKYGKNPLE